MADSISLKLIRRCVECQNHNITAPQREINQIFYTMRCKVCHRRAYHWNVIGLINSKETLKLINTWNRNNGRQN